MLPFPQRRPGEYGITKRLDFQTDSEISTAGASNIFLANELIPFAIRLLGTSQLEYGRPRKFTFCNQGTEPNQVDYLVAELEFEQQRASQSMLGARFILEQTLVETLGENALIKEWANITDTVNHSWLDLSGEDLIPAGTEYFEYDEVAFFEASRYVFSHDKRPRKQKQFGYKLQEDDESYWVTVHSSNNTESMPLPIADSIGAEMSMISYEEECTTELEKSDVDIIHGIMHCFGHRTRSRSHVRKTILPKF